MKKDTVKSPLFFLEDFGRVPSDSFTLSVRVGSKLDIHGITGGFF